jgi:hypothetical protein
MPRTDDSTDQVSDSGRRRGEDIIKGEGKEPGRRDEKPTGAGRPAGSSTSRDATSVNPEAEDPIDPNSPKLPPA